MSFETILIVASAALLGLLILSQAVLRAWHGWLELKRLELDRARPGGDASAASRIDLADLRERLRNLEAIAAGVDL
ncbi:hypothetical protein [Novosphingobium sp. Chol11]|uniref:hypothetical protein n=1 Tax=Novosphingobium sp. Chol11 TaxID=1385763 RepID=UPI0025F9C066|nr:hypothetical protein [Novosphingobium sp. Chol11]